MNDDDLSRLFHELPSPLRSRPGRAAEIVVAARRRRAYAAGAASISTIVLVIVAALALGGGHAGQGSQAARTPAAPVAPTPAPRGTPAQGVLTVSCSAPGRPIALSQIKRGVYGTAAAAPLRAFLVKPGDASDLHLDRLPRTQWALVSHDATHRVFAQRTATGISAVLYFKLYLGSWRPAPQCGIRYGTDTAEHVRQAVVRGRILDLNWDNGTCHPTTGRPISNLVRRVIVTETKTHVLISLITYENPAEVASEASQAAALPSGTVLVCAGVGLADHVKITLKAPLGNRVLLDVSTVPPGPIDLGGTVGKPLT